VCFDARRGFGGVVHTFSTLAQPFLQELDEALDVRRQQALKTGTALNEADRKTFFCGTAQGYIDYPALALC